MVIAVECGHGMSTGFTDATAQRLAAIVEFADDAIISKDLNGVIASWNQAAERIFGYTAEEAVGKYITLIIPTDRLSEEDVIGRIRRGETVDHFETLRRHKNGTLIPISLTVSPIRNADGTIIGASTIARDISDRRRAEAALALAEARQADLQQRLVALVAASGTLFGSPNLADMMPAVLVLARTLLPADGYAMWRFDSTTNRWHIGASTGVSDEFSHRIVEAYHGGPVGAVPFTDPIVADSVEAVPLLEAGLPVYRREGVESILAVPLKIGGRATGTLVFYYRTRHAFTDIEVHSARALGTLAAGAITTAELYDEQRRNREQADRSNQQATFLAEASATLASSLDYEATLGAVANLAVPYIADWCAVDVVDEQGEARRLAVAHVDPEKVEMARTFLERYPDHPESPGSVSYVIRTGKPLLIEEVTDEMLVRSARDEEHLRELRVLGIRSYICVPIVVHGRTLGAITFVTAESAQQYNAADFRFAQDVAYRSALAVENARAYRQANAANRAKDEFLATLSHELRTPLNAVLGWTRMLRGGAISGEKMTRAFEVIERNALAQLDLVEDLLDLSRIITGKFRLEVQPVRLSGAIDAAVEAVQPAATAKGITVDVQAESPADLVLGDAARLQQVVWNLLSNAIKFTPRGGRVEVRVQRGDGHVEVAVSDTGEGVDAAVLPYVFDRFRQGDSGTTRTHMGLGLGLAIVRHIVEGHGGRVEVASAGKGHGATFTISLPAMSIDRPAVAPVVGREASAEPGRATALIDGVRAIVVDDDRDARELLTELLRARGVQVTAAASADECLTALDREVPDVIVSDIAMPGQDGFELIERVRARPAERGGEVPAVALTAYARPQDSDRSLSSGFQAHLSKPVDMDELLTTVANLTGRTAARS